MNRRLLITLNCVLAIYIIPSYIPVHAAWYWLDAIVCSCLLIAYLSCKQLRWRRKINTISAVVISVIAIESFAIICQALAWYEWTQVSSQSQWFYAHYEYIMSACYYVELSIIIAGMASGSYTRINSLCVTFVNRFKAISNSLLHKQRYLCKSTQAI